MKNFIPLTIISVFLLGVSVFFRKLSVDRIHPYQLQIVAGFVYMLSMPLWWYLLKREGGTINYDSMGILWGLLCIVSATASAVLLSYLLKYSDSPSTVAMAVATNPAIVMALSWMFLNESVTLKKIVGCVIAIAGLMLMV